MKLTIEVDIKNAGEENVTREEMMRIIEDEGGLNSVCYGWCDTEDWKLLSIEGNFKEPER